MHFGRFSSTICFTTRERNAFEARNEFGQLHLGQTASFFGDRVFVISENFVAQVPQLMLFIMDNFSLRRETQPVILWHLITLMAR
jgi:hypothetical protein